MTQIAVPESSRLYCVNIMGPGTLGQMLTIGSFSPETSLPSSFQLTAPLSRLTQSTSPTAFQTILFLALEANTSVLLVRAQQLKSQFLVEDRHVKLRDLKVVSEKKDVKHPLPIEEPHRVLIPPSKAEVLGLAIILMSQLLSQASVDKNFITVFCQKKNIQNQVPDCWDF